MNSKLIFTSITLLCREEVKPPPPNPAEEDADDYGGDYDDEDFEVSWLQW